MSTLFVNDPTGNTQYETIRLQPRLIFLFRIIPLLLQEFTKKNQTERKKRKKTGNSMGVITLTKKPTISCCMCYESSRVTSLEQLSLAEFSGV